MGKKLEVVFPEVFDRNKFEEMLGIGLLEGGCYGPKFEPGVCLEQALAAAFGRRALVSEVCEGKSCVDIVAVDVGIRLNDISWSSKRARADGLRNYGYEQLGSKGIDNYCFSKRLLELAVRKYLPYVLMKVARPQAFSPKSKAAMAKVARVCVNGTIAQASVYMEAEFDKYIAVTRHNPAVWLKRAARALAAATESLDNLDRDCLCSDTLLIITNCLPLVGTDAESDKLRILFANIATQALRDAKKEAGLPLFRKWWTMYQQRQLQLA